MVFEIREIEIWWWGRCGLRPTADSAHLGNTTSFLNPPEKFKSIASRLVSKTRTVALRKVREAVIYVLAEFVR